jgi:phosphomannomutase
MPKPLAAILKANDLRGLVPAQWGAVEARALGAALAEHLGPSPILIGRDMRRSGADLATAIARGITSRGVDVIDLGLVSTDACYYASGSQHLPGVMLTASHNPPQYNGMKVMRAGARPVGEHQGLVKIVATAQSILGTGLGGADSRRSGHVKGLDILPDYAAYLRKLVDLSQIKPIKVVVDAGNGMAGKTVPAVLGGAVGLPALPIDVVPLYFKLDGSFPNHTPNPLDPANTADLSAAVRSNGADMGLAFDGDADRCFVIDERGEVVSPGAVTSIVGLGEVARDKARGRRPVVIHNLITSRAVPEFAAAAGAEPIRARVGHAFIKQIMAERGAVFGGEHSAHFYFRDFFYADTGLLAAMHVMRARDAADAPLSELAAMYQPYFDSGEINSKVPDAREAMDRVRRAYADRAAAGQVSLDDLDGLTVDHWDESPRWWANVRSSNTEPLLRLNVEADDPAVMESIRDELLDLIRDDA